ncbi:hypothetical protein UK23_43725 [Lentzea aerocolonigenes]|uniref:Uncharacterized protein n=1 Tax=Lentzea aerocolonigenes TaxID=68170 RepID=A0A0F0GCT4_LENAE|nr:hypothetical protein [Lentzea aerocolonigenes]KJK34327.1 hypothetical protein UK23_43725 [Lentzea aerocolonigenes]
MIMAVAEDGRTLDLSPDGPLVDCLTWDELAESVTISLHTWFSTGLDLKLLVRHGLPVWCARHRIARAESPCGRLQVAQ